MQASSPPRAKFSWAKGITAAAIFIILVVALLPLLSLRSGRLNGRHESPAKYTMGTLTMALEKYRQDFNDFPPDNFPTDNGSEMIWYYLCRLHKDGDNHYGPYMKASENQLVDSVRLQTRKFLSPLGGDYHYIRLVDNDGISRSYLLVDPGSDKMLGGFLNRENGFVEEDERLAADNIYSTVPLSMYKRK